MKFYHRTREAAAEAILRDGFRDGRGTYMTGQVFEGVWISNIPLDANEGAHGPVLLAITIPIVLVRDYEWVEEGKGYREFLVPARTLNAYGRVRIERIDAWCRSSIRRDRQDEDPGVPYADCLKLELASDPGPEPTIDDAAPEFNNSVSGPDGLT